MPTSKSFASSVLILLGGTSVALVVPLVASPVLSHIYTPEMFGQLAVFASAVSIGAIAATGRYELAIPIPKSNITALSVAVVACISAGFISVLASLGLTFLSLSAPKLLGSALSTTAWVAAVPICTMMLACIQILTYLQSRRQAYGVVAEARAGQAIAMTGAQLGAGMLGLGGMGLIGGYIIGAVVSLWRLTRSGWNDLHVNSKRLHRRWLFAAAKRFANMPKFLVIGHLANVVSSQLPVIMLATLYGSREAGLYAFAERMTVIPCAVVANAVGEVFRQSAAQIFQREGNCLDLFLKTKLKLAALAFVFAFAIVTAAPTAFSLMFGDAWREAGQLAVSLGIIAFFQTVSSPLSQTVYLSSVYKGDLAWQLARLLLSAACIYVGFILFADFKTSVFLHSLMFALAYTLHSVMQYQVARGNRKL